MRGLKVVVIVMGVLIVVMTTVMIAVIIGRMAKHAEPGRPPPEAYAATPITIPPGARIETMTTGADRLIVALALPGGGHRILVIDLKTGAPVGAIALKPAP